LVYIKIRGRGREGDRWSCVQVNETEPFLGLKEAYLGNMFSPCEGDVMPNELGVGI
jgi:hypothetical protein